MAKLQTEVPQKSISEMISEANEPRYNAQSPESPLTASELDRLGEMTREELIGLYRLLNAKQVGYALLTKDEKRERLKMKVYGIAMESTSEAAILKAANDWLDREDGKAMQQIRQETHVTGAVAVMSADEVRRYIDEWNTGKNQYMVIDEIPLIETGANMLINKDKKNP